MVPGIWENCICSRVLGIWEIVFVVQVFEMRSMIMGYEGTLTLRVDLLLLGCRDTCKDV